MAMRLKLEGQGSRIDEFSVLSALGIPIVVIEADNRILYVNAASEQFFDRGESSIIGHRLNQMFNKDSPIISLVKQVQINRTSVFEHDIELSGPRGNSMKGSAHVTLLLDNSDKIVISFHLYGAARSMERQLVHRGAARSVTAMASMLAHEVKNPLAGIRGAAQLLEKAVSDRDRGLTELIREEADRICNLVDRMTDFGDEGPPGRAEINIHEILDRVHSLVAAEFGDKVHFVKDYDPSLPMVWANKDQLIQVFLNLVKNGIEAILREPGIIRLATGFKRGVALSVPGSNKQVHLPLMVSVTDNGCGISDDISQNIFDPFVSTKTGGTGLGLALVSKLIQDHGGVIEFETGYDGSCFRIYFPVIVGLIPEVTKDE